MKKQADEGNRSTYIFPDIDTSIQHVSVANGQSSELPEVFQLFLTKKMLFEDLLMDPTFPFLRSLKLILAVKSKAAHTVAKTMITSSHVMFLVAMPQYDIRTLQLQVQREAGKAD